MIAFKIQQRMVRCSPVFVGDLDKNSKSGQRNINTGTRITMLIRRPIPPFASSLCISPSQKRIKINEEKIVEPTTTGCHHTCLMRIAIPLATKPITVHMQQMLVSHLVASSQRSLENAHESSGQTISG